MLTPDPLYGLAFSHSPLHPHRAALTTLSTGPSNKLIIVDPSQSNPSEYTQLASVNVAFPATKIAWEPSQSLQQGSYDQSTRPELIATSGHVLRIWDLAEEWHGDTARGYVGRNGYGPEYSLNARSVLTNVRED